MGLRRSRTMRIDGSSGLDGARRETCGIQAHPHDAAVPPARGDEEGAVGRDRHLADRVPRRDRDTEGREAFGADTTERLHRPRPLESGVDDVERRVRGDPGGRPRHRDGVSLAAQLSAGERIVGGAGIQHRDPRRRALRRGVAAHEEAHGISPRGRAGR
ncbi:hypothetical protein GCM10009643_26430 [Microbacterium aurantiacum]